MKPKQANYFNPISGIDENRPLCYFLHFEGFNILLDCGISNGDLYLEKLKDIAPKLDVILLSHSSFEHIGGLPYLLEDCECSAQVFATLPTIKMGENTTFDYYQNLSRVSEIDFDSYREKVENAFKKVKELKFTESFVIQREEKNQVIILQPFNSGYSLGGSVWKITNEVDSIIYCVDFDIKQTNYLDGLDMRIFETKPTLVILDSKVFTKRSAKESSPEKRMLEIILKTTVEDKGNLLIPSDTCGRSLELACLFEKFWRENDSLRDVELHFLTNVSMRTIQTHASQQLQFMNRDIIERFNENRENPFHFRYCKVSQSLSKLNEMSSNVVISSSKNLDFGFSRDVFLKWVQNERNGILLVEPSMGNSLAGKLYSYVVAKNMPGSLDLHHRTKEPLGGEEFEQYKEKKLREKQEEIKRNQEEEARKRIVLIHDDEVDIDDRMMKDDEEIEEKGESFLSDTFAAKRNNPFLFLPENMRYQSKYLMFPPKIEETFVQDDYGEIVDVDNLRSISMKMLQQGADNLDGEMNEKEDIDRMMMNRNPRMSNEILPPMVVVEKEIHLKLNSKFYYVGYEGRATSESVKNILNQIKPRQIMLIHANNDDRESLKQYCVKNQVCKIVINPTMEFEEIEFRCGEIFQVKLAINLMEGCKFLNFNKYDMGFFEGEYMLPKIENKKDEEKDGDEDLENIELEEPGENKDITIITEKAEKKGHPPLFIGDVKLNKFKEILNEKGITTQFKMGGGIICNNSILITKDKKSGKVGITGPLCREYLLIRDILYEQYNIL